MISISRATRVRLGSTQHPGRRLVWRVITGRTGKIGWTRVWHATLGTSRWTRRLAIARRVIVPVMWAMIPCRARRMLGMIYLCACHAQRFLIMRIGLLRMVLPATLRATGSAMWDIFGRMRRAAKRARIPSARLDLTSLHAADWRMPIATWCAWTSASRCSIPGGCKGASGAAWTDTLCM